MIKKKGLEKLKDTLSILDNIMKRTNEDNIANFKVLNGIMKTALRFLKNTQRKKLKLSIFTRHICKNKAQESSSESGASESES
jgi:hypothetical protein